MSQYSLLGQTPPRSAPDSPAIHARDSLSAAPSEEPAPVVEEGGQTVTADICDPELTADAKSDPSTTQSSDQRTALVSPVIVVTQQFDASPTETPSTTAESSNSATPDSDAAVTHEVGTPDAPANPESTNPVPDSPDLSMPDLSLPQSTDVPAEGVQSDQSAAPENSATPDLSISDQVTEDATSLQHPCPSTSHPACKDSPIIISLGSLSEAIGCNLATPSVMQTMAQQTTDRAVYLTGEIKDNWEVERVKEEKQIEVAEEKGAHERIKEGKEETGTGEGKEEEIKEVRGEGQMGGVAQTGGGPVEEPKQFSESPAESATALTTEQSEEKVDDGEKDSELEAEKRKDEEEAEEKGDHVEKEGKKEKEEEEVLQSPQPMESQPESDDEVPLDSVAIIRELVTEITEVETVVGPCPNNSHTL